MKALTTNVLDKMLAYAEMWMANEQWSPDEIMVFKSDPIVRLLYGACAEEIGNIQEEIFHVKQRLINETIEKLLPEEFHTPTPAHTILHARPIDKSGESKIGIESHFIIKKPDNTRKDFIFTPAGQFTLSQADVKYLVFRDTMFMFDQDKKERVLTSSSSLKFQSDVLWLGIKDLNRFLPKDKISIFFHLPLTSNDQLTFLNFLKYCSCHAEEQLLPVSIGLTSDEAELKKKMLRQRKTLNPAYGTDEGSALATEDVDTREKLLKDPDFMIFKLIQDVREWYHKQFVTIHNLPKRSTPSNVLPDDLSRLLGEEAAQIKDDIYWIKFSFGNLLDERWVSQLFCSMNCFPVLNLKPEKSDFNVESMPVNIFPLISDDAVLCLNSVRGKVMNRPEETDYRLMEPNPHRTVAREGDAIFRKGGLGRQDPRKLKNMLNLLSNILKEETILLTKDGTRDDLNKLNRLTRALNEFDSSIDLSRDEKVKHMGSIILIPYKYHSKVFIRFWTTAAEEANQIRPMKGEDARNQCEVFFGPDIKPDSLRLITNTAGGKKKPTEDEHLDTVRKLILTRGRIVTVEDIKAFCYEQFSGQNIVVDVRKSVGQSKTPGFGLVRTVEINITFPDKGNMKEDEVTLLKDELLQKLEQNSNNVMPFVITIN